MLPFELLFRELIKFEMPNEGKEFIKCMLKDSVSTSFPSYNYNIEFSLTKNEQLTLNNLSTNTNIAIEKSTVLFFLTKIKS